MAALLSLVVVLAVSHLAIRTGASALALTGVSDEVARFQAQSAFFGVGFTTRESELVLSHPVRRRIVMVLMLLGNAGVVASVSSVVVLFATGRDGRGDAARVLALLATVIALWAVARSAPVDRNVTGLVRWALRRWTRLDVRDFVSLLHLSGGFGIVQLEVRPGTWLAGRTLAELDLRSEGAIVLGIERRATYGDVPHAGQYLGVPRGPVRLFVGDVLLVYGHAALLEALDRRPRGEAGDREHAAAVERQRRRLGIGWPTAPNGRCDAGHDDLLRPVRETTRTSGRDA